MSRAARRGRTLAAIAVAVLLHAAFVAWLLASATRLWPPGERPAVELALSALARPPASTAAEPQAAGARRPAASASAHTASTSAEARRPAPSSPHAGGEPAQGSDHPVTGGDAAGDGAALRAIGALFACHSGALDALDAPTRARCEATRLAQARAAPGVDGVPAEKRAYYDAVVAKVEEARALPPPPRTFRRCRAATDST